MNAGFRGRSGYLGCEGVVRSRVRQRGRAFGCFSDVNVPESTDSNNSVGCTAFIVGIIYAVAPCAWGLRGAGLDPYRGRGKRWDGKGPLVLVVLEGGR